VWKPEQIAQHITAGAIFRRLQKQTQEAVAAIPQEELSEGVAALLRRPQPRSMPHARTLANLVYAAQYYEVFEALELPNQLSVYEPCVGGSDPVIVAAEAYSHGQANYLTVNLNRQLREELQGKIAHLESSIRIIDDNAQNAMSHLKPNSVDVACFHHAINDILQTAVSEPRGMDTATVDWWPNERQMIEWMAEDYEAGLMEEHGKKELMEIISHAAELVRSGSYLVFDHWSSFGYSDVDWFPWELFCDLIPITRQWIAESELPVVEVEISDADPQWWMFFRVEK
jgi:hypothetical protein